MEQKEPQVAVGIFDPLKAKEALNNSTTLSTVSQSRKLTGNPLVDDLRVFLTLLWRHLGLPDPTPLQLDFAYYLQHHKRSGELDHQVLMAFRGMAKSWITAAFVLWNLYRNPQMKILVASGSKTRSANFVNFCLALINEVEILKHLAPRQDQRQSTQAFDVGPAHPDQTPSVFAVGITSQIVGFRGDLIIGDDVETNTNSMTVTMREKLANSVKEFDAILKPGGQVIFLGTPQTESSIYNVLATRGYVIKIWPVRYPTGTQRRAYGDKLAPYIMWRISNDPKLIGKSTEPTRFSEEDLTQRERSWGRAGFALQFMLDTSLSDVEKYPLRLSDLIVMDLDHKVGPDVVAWGNGDHLAIRDVSPISLDGDRLYGPANVSQSFSAWEDIRAFIDPSGKGADETTLTIGAVLHSRPFILKQAGWQDGYSETTLEAIATLLVQYNVSSCRVEEDFGAGMFAQLLRPVVKRLWEKKRKDGGQGRMGTEIISERSAKVQKELRILESLEPPFQSHKLVVDKRVFIEDYAQVGRRGGTDMSDRYSLMYQITRLTRERDCLTHDDRVEGLGGLLKSMSDMLGRDSQEQAEDAQQRREDELLGLLEEEEAQMAGATATPHRRRDQLLRPGKRT